MPFVPVKCTSCGGDIQLDDQKEHGFCVYCGTKVIFQEAVQKMKLELSGSISVDGIATLDRMYQRVETLLKLDDHYSAERTLLEITKNYPEEYRAWWMLAKLFAENKMLGIVDYHIKDIVDDKWCDVNSCFTIKRNIIEGDIIEPLTNYVGKAIRVAPEDKVEGLKKDCRQLIESIGDALEKKRKAHKEKLSEEIASYQTAGKEGRSKEIKAKFTSQWHKLITVLLIALIAFLFLLVPAVLNQIHPVGILVGIAIMVIVAKIVKDKWSKLLDRDHAREMELFREVAGSTHSKFMNRKELETADRLYNFCIDSLHKHFKT